MLECWRAAQDASAADRVGELPAVAVFGRRLTLCLSDERLWARATKAHPRGGGAAEYVTREY